MDRDDVTSFLDAMFYLTANREVRRVIDLKILEAFQKKYAGPIPTNNTDAEFLAELGISNG